MEKHGKQDWGENMEKSIDGVIDISEKNVVERKATATGLLYLSEDSKVAIIEKKIQKGDVIEASTIAAIQAVKDTPRIIPHCHPIPLEGCNVSWAWEGNNLRCSVSVNARYKTGIEMEALTGVSAGLLCAFDMVKSIEKDNHGQYPDTAIGDIRVVKKFKSE